MHTRQLSSFRHHLLEMQKSFRELDLRWIRTDFIGELSSAYFFILQTRNYLPFHWRCRALGMWIALCYRNSNCRNTCCPISHPSVHLRRWKVWLKIFHWNDSVDICHLCSYNTCLGDLPLYCQTPSRCGQHLFWTRQNHWIRTCWLLNNCSRRTRLKPYY